MKINGHVQKILANYESDNPGTGATHGSNDHGR
jgi:hypothetical protein